MKNERRNSGKVTNQDAIIYMVHFSCRMPKIEDDYDMVACSCCRELFHNLTYTEISIVLRSFRVFRIIVLSSVPFRSVPFRGVDLTPSVREHCQRES